MPPQPQSKKKRVLEALYAACKEREDFAFSNKEVREACARIGFGNPFDATKIDSSTILPDALAADDAFVVDLGRGYYRFETIPNRLNNR